jgi:glycosyltransferase involved in cell wall biosynthesis
MVSVIIPTRNRSELVRRSILSVIAQTYCDFELIIVDDASEDNTYSAVHEIADPRIKYLKNSRRRGAAVSRNLGIKSARGQYIAFLDSDDEWLSNKLDRQMALFQALPKKVGAIYTGLTAINRDRRKVSTRIPTKAGNIVPEIYYDNIIGPLSTLVVRSVCLTHAGLFDERLPSCQDWEFCIRIAQNYHFAYDEDSLVNYLLSDDSITQDMEAKATGHKMVLKKYYAEITPNRKAHSRQRWTIGHYYGQSGHVGKARNEFVRAISAYPLATRPYIYLLCSLLGARVYRKLVKLRHTL